MGLCFLFDPCIDLLIRLFVLSVHLSLVLFYSSLLEAIIEFSLSLSFGEVVFDYSCGLLMVSIGIT